jgi:hypothetical protein
MMKVEKSRVQEGTLQGCVVFGMPDLEGSWVQILEYRAEGALSEKKHEKKDEIWGDALVSRREKEHQQHRLCACASNREHVVQAEWAFSIGK